MITIALRKRTLSPVRLVLRVTFFCCFMSYVTVVFLCIWGVLTRLWTRKGGPSWPSLSFLWQLGIAFRVVSTSESLDQSAQSSDGAVIRCVRGANIEEKVRIPSGMEVDDELLTFLHRSKLVGGFKEALVLLRVRSLGDLEVVCRRPTAVEDLERAGLKRIQARNLMSRLEVLIQKRLEAKLAVLPPPVSVGVPLEGEAGTRLQAAHALATDIHSNRSQAEDRGNAEMRSPEKSQSSSKSPPSPVMSPEDFRAKMEAAKATAEADRVAAQEKAAAWEALLEERRAVGKVAWQEGAVDVPDGVGIFGKTTWAPRHAVFSKATQSLVLFLVGDPQPLMQYTMKEGSALLKGKVGLGWRVEFSAECLAATVPASGADENSGDSSNVPTSSSSSQVLRFQVSSMQDALDWCTAINGARAAVVMDAAERGSESRNLSFNHLNDHGGGSGSHENGHHTSKATVAKQLEVAMWSAALTVRAKKPDTWYEGPLDVKVWPKDVWTGRMAVFNRLSKTLELFPADVATNGGEPMTCLEVASDGFAKQNHRFVNVSVTCTSGEWLGASKTFNASFQAPTMEEAEEWGAVFNGQDPDEPALIRAAEEEAAAEAREKMKAETLKAQKEAAAQKAKAKAAALEAKQGLAAREAATQQSREASKRALWETGKSERAKRVLEGSVWEGRIEGGGGAVKHCVAIPKNANYVVYDRPAKQLQLMIEFNGEVAPACKVVQGSAVMAGRAGPLRRKFKITLDITASSSSSSTPPSSSSSLDTPKLPVRQMPSAGGYGAFTVPTKNDEEPKSFAAFRDTRDTAARKLQARVRGRQVRLKDPADLPKAALEQEVAQQQKQALPSSPSRVKKNSGAEAPAERTEKLVLVWSSEAEAQHWCWVFNGQDPAVEVGKAAGIEAAKMSVEAENKAAADALASQTAAEAKAKASEAATAWAAAKEAREKAGGAVLEGKIEADVSRSAKEAWQARYAIYDQNTKVLELFVEFGHLTHRYRIEAGSAKVVSGSGRFLGRSKPKVHLLAVAEHLEDLSVSPPVPTIIEEGNEDEEEKEEVKEASEKNSPPPPSSIAAVAGEVAAEPLPLRLQCASEDLALLWCRVFNGSTVASVGQYKTLAEASKAARREHNDAIREEKEAQLRASRASIRAEQEAAAERHRAKQEAIAAKKAATLQAQAEHAARLKVLKAEREAAERRKKEAEEAAAEEERLVAERRLAERAAKLRKESEEKALAAERAALAAAAIAAGDVMEHDASDDDDDDDENSERKKELFAPGDPVLALIPSDSMNEGPSWGSAVVTAVHKVEQSDEEEKDASTSSALGDAAILTHALTEVGLEELGSAFIDVNVHSCADITFIQDDVLRKKLNLSREQINALRKSVRKFTSKSARAMRVDVVFEDDHRFERGLALSQLQPAPIESSSEEEDELPEEAFPMPRKEKAPATPLPPKPSEQKDIVSPSSKQHPVAVAVEEEKMTTPATSSEVEGSGDDEPSENTRREPVEAEAPKEASPEVASESKSAVVDSQTKDDAAASSAVETNASENPAPLEIASPSKSRKDDTKEDKELKKRELAEEKQRLKEEKEAEKRELAEAKRRAKEEKEAEKRELEETKRRAKEEMEIEKRELAEAKRLAKEEKEAEKREAAEAKKQAKAEKKRSK